jgi:hypothetical protein
MRGEVWRDYVQRSCKEVKDEFSELVRDLDIQRLVAEWPTLSILLLSGGDPEAVLFFVAYFVTEQDTSVFDQPSVVLQTPGSSATRTLAINGAGVNWNQISWMHL